MGSEERPRYIFRADLRLEGYARFKISALFHVSESFLTFEKMAGTSGKKRQNDYRRYVLMLISQRSIALECKRWNDLIGATGGESHEFKLPLRIFN